MSDAPQRFPYYGVDATGTRIQLGQPAERIVSLTATGLDCLIELGLTPVGYLSQGVADQPEFYSDRAQSFMNAGSWIFPNRRAIRKTQPDLILGWRFPHRFYRGLNNIAPLYLMVGAGHDTAVARLRQIGQLTGREQEAEDAIASLDHQIQAVNLKNQHRPTVLIMGGSTINCILNCFPVETDTGTLGSVLQHFTVFPWSKPDSERGEPGLIYLSLRQILAIDPDLIFIQSYPPLDIPLSQQLANNTVWKQLKAVQTQQVYEIEPFWHWGNGTRLIRLMLRRLLPLIYPQCEEIMGTRGLQQRELCDLMGYSYREIAQSAKAQGLSTHAYLRQLTQWQLQNERYYPPRAAN